MTQGKSVMVDDEDYEYLNQWKWHAVRKHNNLWYAIRGVRANGTVVSTILHRDIMKTPKDKVVDHKDRNGLNCQKQNMRNCTHNENMWNRKCKGASKYNGVSFALVRGKYKYITAGISTQGVRYFLGNFKTEEAAAHAYDTKAKELFGEFAYLNFPNK